MRVKDLIKELELYDRELPVFFGERQVIGVDLGAASLKGRLMYSAKILVQDVEA